MKASFSAIATDPAQEQDSTATIWLLRPWKRMILRRGMPTLRYLVKTEAHTFAFSVAANVILSFFPFVVLIGWLVRNVFHSSAMFEIVLALLKNQLPIGQEFLARNLRAVVEQHHGFKIFSMVMLLVSSSGVFLPLEVAFNQIWGFPKNRSYIGNQIISLALAFACGVLALFSVTLGTAHEVVVDAVKKAVMTIMPGGAGSTLAESAFGVSTFAVLKILSLLASIAIFFLLYWILPNGKVRIRSVLPAAVAMGLLWDLSRYIYVGVLPWLNFQDVYGPFTISVTLMFWAFVSGLLVLAGAHLAAEPETEALQANADEDSSEISFTALP
jgi:YihY family inner membrane protein